MKYYSQEDINKVISQIATEDMPVGLGINPRSWCVKLLKELPTIEVSEDAISRATALEIYSDLYWVDERLLNFKDELDKVYEKLRTAPSVISVQPNIEYILSQLADLLDEYSELDEHGLHDPKWCGVNEAYLIVKNASQKPKEGEWIPCSERMPSENQAVLVCAIGGIRFTGKLIRTDTGYKWSIPLFVTWMDVEDGDAWMPLPKPWKGADDE